jgi:hypothetical protein
VDDGRFPFEADAFRERSWLIVKVDAPFWLRIERAELLTGRRPTFDELNHPTETMLNDIEYDMFVSGMTDPNKVAKRIMERARNV